MYFKVIRILFIIRLFLCAVAIGATAWWIRWSFQIYEMGIYNEYEYAKALRPVFSKCLLISAICICISLILRTISDKLKKKKTKEDING